VEEYERDEGGESENKRSVTIENDEFWAGERGNVGEEIGE